MRRGQVKEQAGPRGGGAPGPGAITGGSRSWSRRPRRASPLELSEKNITADLGKFGYWYILLCQTFIFSFTGYLSNGCTPPHHIPGNGSMGGTRGRMGISYLHSHGGGNVDAMAQQRRLGSLWSFLRQQDVGESIAAGDGSSDLLRIFSMSTCDDTNSNIIFSVPGSKKAEVLGNSDVGMVTSFSNIDSRLQQDSADCRVHAKRGCTTDPQSIAWEERRTRTNKRLRRLQDLIPYMDKVTSKPRWRLGNKELAQLWKWAELNPDKPTPNKDQENNRYAKRQPFGVKDINNNRAYEAEES
ncbi:hypothetical protein TRIUR3_14018 [Triticum urartu]|uniref:BHLH domain-containing protein n=1 Tax=Triticum urartu TaxID=4572 RepID=M8A4T8_TRIUA|nr:hypothetical protein TRIUR3_14018 [Triticum urartu]